MSLKLTLQKALFESSGEKVIQVVDVTKAQKKKKKMCFLCVVVNVERNIPLLYKIKKYDLQYKKHSHWYLSDLRAVDGKRESKQRNEFELLFSGKQSCKWLANTVQEKHHFIQMLHKLCEQYLVTNKPKFLNIPKEVSMDTELEKTSEMKTNLNAFDVISVIKTTTDSFDMNGFEEESYQALTNREESDLERLMEQCEFTINNAEAFTEKLSRELSSMDSSNIQNIMASEQKVESLMKVLQCSVDEANKLEQRIEHYQNLLKNVRDIVLQVEQKEALVQTQTENSQKLLTEIESLISDLEFPPEKEKNLFATDLSTSSGLTMCLLAAHELQECLTANIHPAYSYMNAVQEQKKYLEDVQKRFSSRLYTEMNAIFDMQVAHNSERFLQSMNSKDLVLSNHEIIHNALMPYASFIKWLKMNNENSFMTIQNSYLMKMKPLYESEIVHYFELVREKLSGGKLTIGSIDSFEGKRRMRSSSFQGMGQEFLDSSSSRSSDISLSEWEEFDSCVERMLSTIEPAYMCEQKFCIAFFDIDIQAEADSRRSNSICSQNQSISPSPSNLSQNSGELSDIRKAEGLRRMMSGMFVTLESEFVKFISNYDKLDGMYSMYLLVRLTQHVLSTQDAGSFLAKTYGNILIHVKRNFDKFMQSQVQAIEDTKAPKKPKCGVFPFIKRFEQFAKQAENVFKLSSSRRTDIDRWYVILLRTMFDTINRLSDTHQKTPPEMVRLENYHYLHDVLCTLKIVCLENEKKEAKLRYNEALKDYVARYFGRPLERLNTFFEGVQMKVAQGVKQEEVGYQLAFSKQELRKVINSCSLKDIKKGLEEMYRKVEKHTCEPDSTLIQVIWRSMQEEFLSQHKAIHDMIERCYPDANVSLSFTVDDVLSVFSEIAQSH